MENDTNKISDNDRISVIDNSMHSAGDVILLNDDKKISDLESQIRDLDKILHIRNGMMIDEQTKIKNLEKSVFDKNVFLKSFETMILRLIKLYDPYIDDSTNNSLCYTFTNCKYKKYRIDAIKSSLELRNIPISVMEDICNAGYPYIDGFIVRFEEEDAFLVIVINPDTRSKFGYESWIDVFESKIIGILRKYSLETLDYFTALSNISEYKISDSKFEFVIKTRDIINE